jgi:hypothetical protein
MAKQTINIGAAANDGTGDPIRTAFGKVNDNFTEIYTANTGVNTGDQNLAAYATTAAVAAGYQPLDSDLTAIAALTTTAYGRALLSTTDAPTLRTAIGLGQTDAPTFLAQTLTGQSLTGTQATSLVDLAATWNTTGTPTAIKLQVTNTNSNAAALLLDLQVGLVSKASITKGGQIASGFGYTYAQPQFYDSSIGVAAGFQILSSSGVAAYGGGTAIWGVDNGATIGMRLASHIPLGWTSSHALSNVPDVALFRDAAGILAQRNGTAAQAFRVYNTFPGTTANEWFEIDWKTGANTVRLFTNHAGTGGARSIDISAGATLFFGSGTSSPIRMYSSGVERWNISSTGHFIAATHNAYDIGAAGGVNCPRNIFVAQTVRANAFQLNATSHVYGTVDGIIGLYNSALNNFDRLQLGGTTSAFPAIKRSTTSLQARLADDSAFTNIQGKLTTDTAYTATVVVPTGFLTLYDSTGTAYRVPCVV